MDFKIEVRHARKTLTPGTLPWTLANAGHILIGVTKQGNQGAWLKDKDDKPITILAMRNAMDDETDGDPSGPIATVQPYSEQGDYDFSLYADRTFTDAAWKLIERLAQRAKEEMESAVRAEDAECGDDVFVEVKVIRDPTASQLARAAGADRTVVPVLKDRIKEGA